MAKRKTSKPRYMLQKMEKASIGPPTATPSERLKNVWVDAAGPFETTANAVSFVRTTGVVGVLRVIRIVQGPFDSTIKETKQIMAFNDLGEPDTEPKEDGGEEG